MNSISGIVEGLIPPHMRGPKDMVCPKCECNMLTTWFHKDAHAQKEVVRRAFRLFAWPMYATHTCPGYELGEHLMLRCQRCDYTWTQACADAIVKQDKPKFNDDDE